ncbi:hypothetical protein QAD02_018364 [Eretmocerus hayati]|uniref:Uncharacterized protein n=1 Tax=Eretmocerus hayati TaxID=131215 RepID=A0ACC2PJJ3_9HYME|nr:hypothetical protein QAD02_018364 [Eretmocerus hayati]
MLKFCFAVAILCIGSVNSNMEVYSSNNKLQTKLMDVPAKFGGRIPAEGIKGIVVPVKPKTACSAVQSPPNDAMYKNYKKLALIELDGHKGDNEKCTFEVKVRNAQNAGFDAAVVHYYNSDDYVEMAAKNGNGITIPAVFISGTSALLLEDQVYPYTSGYYVILNNTPGDFSGSAITTSYNN